jgi:hypothetical protein
VEILRRSTAKNAGGENNSSISCNGDISTRIADKEGNPFIIFSINNIIRLQSTSIVNSYHLWEAVDILGIAFVIAVVVDRHSRA